MPIYGYACGQCKTVTEELRDISDRNKASQCDCGGDLSRSDNPQLTFKLKGRGWAKDRYCSKNLTEVLHTIEREAGFRQGSKVRDIKPPPKKVQVSVG